ncbi:MAG: hypothetical protein RL662_439 [Bacteroidota bacterium]|jgi:hypothetical protein
MQITATDTHILIRQGKQTSSYPKDGVYYTLNDNSQGLTLFYKHRSIGTAAINTISVNGEVLTHSNVHQLLLAMYSNMSQPDNTADTLKHVILNQSQYDTLDNWDDNTIYYVY